MCTDEVSDAGVQEQEQEFRTTLSTSIQYSCTNVCGRT